MRRAVGITQEELANLSGLSPNAVSVLAAVASSRDEAERSAILLGAAEASLREVGAPVYNYYVPDPALRERAVAETRETLGEAVFDEAHGRGEAMTFEEAVGYASGTTPRTASKLPDRRAGPEITAF